MTTVKNIAGVGGHKVFTPTQYLAGMYPFTNGSGNTVIDTRSDVGTTLKTKSTQDVSAGFWGTSGRGTFGATNDRFGNPSFTEYEIGAATTSFIFSFRINIAATETNSGVIFAKRKQSNGTGQKVYAFSSVLRHSYKTITGSLNNLISNVSTDISDGNNHHVVLVVDKIGNRNFYIDGSLSYGSGEQDMTVSNLAGDAETPGENFMIGAEGILEATLNNSLFDGAGLVELWDCHLYTKDGALPSNLLDLVAYLNENIYSPIPTKLWP